MSSVPILSVAEFISLRVAGKGPFPVPAISIVHSERLAALDFIAAVDGGFEMTATGRFRIAMGA